ncbi:DNA replication licensing factor mcm10 [Podospora conica]|nr:DNA replication licensing factor mcm10 [Schizothecium conicum]
MAAQWPPRSPHDVLLSTPSGRERLRRMAERQSPSPSPSKLRTSRNAAMMGGRNAMDEDLLDEDVGDDEDDEDEEMLKLKLQAIEARLKLKKLQAARAQRKASISKPASEMSNASRPASVAQGNAAEVGIQALPIQSKLAAARDRMERAIAPPSVQVPASPVKKAQAAGNVQTSPQRVLLGIDKGRRAAEMSLKRPPLFNKKALEEKAEQGGYLRRTKTPVPGQDPGGLLGQPISFNERLASARSEETVRQERQQRIQKIRSKAFSVGQKEMEDYKTKAQDIPEVPFKPQEYSRDDILSGNAGGSGQPQRSNPPLPGQAPEEKDSASVPSFESYSGIHLSRRILPHPVLTRAITGMKTYVLKDLLRHVKAPDWSLPDIESDVVVFAIIASKSDPRSHRPRPGADAKDKGKYMVVTLVDLDYEVELFLFNTGFDRFWKLTPGTLLAILNPTILPPPPGRQDTGKFGLVINSDADTILEIGKARDLDYCKSIKKDGQLCSSWINARRTEYCEFHTNEALRKARGSRFELNNTTTFGTGGGHNAPRGKIVRGGHYEKNQADGKKGKQGGGGGQYDKYNHSHYFISGAHRGAADLLDDEGGFADRAEREEALKRRLQRQEREREIAKRLSEMGGGAGKAYMAHKTTAANATAAANLKSSTATSSAAAAAAAGVAVEQQNPLQPAPRWDARALGLVGKRGGDGPKMSLAPVKRKRPDSSASGSSSVASGGGSGALGWGGALTGKLARMKDGEKLDGSKPKNDDVFEVEMPPPPPPPPPSRGGSRSPVRKKTRFVTDKGIREAGRDSLGEGLSAAAKMGRRVVVLEEDDDDDLIIVR